MIKTFADKHTHELFTSERSKRIPPEIVRRARRKLECVDVATRLEDRKVPPGTVFTPFVMIARDSTRFE